MNGKMKILIAYDGSDCANAALTDLRRAGLPKEVEAIVLSVADVWIWSTVGNEAVMPVYARAYAGAWNKEREESLQAVEEAQAMAREQSNSSRIASPIGQSRLKPAAIPPPGAS